MSLPSRERGLKSYDYHSMTAAAPVAPLAGARIEIIRKASLPEMSRVAPLAGARIEIWKREKLKIWRNSRSPRGSAD